MDCLLGLAYGSYFNANQHACNLSPIGSTESKRPGHPIRRVERALRAMRFRAVR